MAILHYYDTGGVWRSPYFLYPKLWNGTDWVYVKPNYWDGSQWRFVDLSSGSFNVTVGSTAASLIFTNLTNGGGAFYDTFYGFSSIAPASVGTTTPFGTSANTSITSLYWLDQVRDGARGYFVTDTLVFSYPSSLGNFWTSVTIGSTQFLASNATVSVVGNTTTWQWNAPINPFGTSLGANIQVTFA